MTAGYEGIHCKVRCHVEINDRYAEWLRPKQVPVLHGDIDCEETLQALAEHMDTPCIITERFCMPALFVSW